MSPGFGEPTYDEAGTAAAQNGQAEAPQELIDPNDPQLTSEAVDVNLEGDAYAVPAPPPDGAYRVRVKLLQKDDGRGGKVDYAPAKWGKDQRLVLTSGIEAHIVDPSGKYDGIALYDRTVSTFIGRDGSHKVSTILARLKRPDGRPWVAKGERLTQTEWMQRFVQAMAGEPEMGVATQWGWSCQACGEAADKKGERRPREILGMAKFPVDAKASKPGAPVYVPEMRCQANPAHGFARAQARIASFLGLDELAKAQAASAAGHR